MLVLSENFVLDSDKLQFILQERHINKDKDSKNFGKEYFTNAGYFNDVKGVLNYIIRHDLKDGLETLEEIIEAIIGVEEYFDKLLEADRKGKGNL